MSKQPKKREEELKKLLSDCDNGVIEPLVEEILFLEDNLVKLKELPFIITKSGDNARQKATPAAKQYKELLQQYTNCIKTLMSATGKNKSEEDSPLRKWANEHGKMESR